VQVEKCTGDYECTKMAEKVLFNVKESARKKAKDYCELQLLGEIGASKAEFVYFIATDVVPRPGSFLVAGNISCVVYDS
jgi:hypothetical protein